MTIKERINQFIEQCGISTSAFEKKCGFSKGFVKNIVNTITIEKMQSILSAFPEINPGWLITGNGSMLLPKNDAEALLSEFLNFAKLSKEEGSRIIAPLFRDNSRMGDFVTDGSLKVVEKTVEDDRDCAQRLEHKVETLIGEIEHLKERLASMQSTIDAKDETIRTQSRLIEHLSK